MEHFAFAKWAAMAADNVISELQEQYLFSARSRPTAVAGESHHVCGHIIKIALVARGLNTSKIGEQLIISKVKQMKEHEQESPVRVKMETSKVNHQVAVS